MNYFGKNNDFGYIDNTIKSRFSVRPFAGNVQSSFDNLNEICIDPLPTKMQNLISSVALIRGFIPEKKQQKAARDHDISQNRCFYNHTFKKKQLAEKENLFKLA